jgi:hypothetical protein
VSLLRLSFMTLAIAAVCVACSTADAPTGVCPDDQGCPDGQVCAFGLCLDPTDQRLSTVDIEIDGGDGHAVQTEFDVDLKASPRVDITLAPTVLVTGSVVSEDDTAVDAVVVAQPPQSVPGRVLAPSSTTDVDGAFSFLVVAGTRYGLTISPQSGDLPPVYDQDDLEAEADDGTTQSLDPFLVEDGDIVLTGRVVAGDGVNSLGIDSLDVRIVDVGRRVSSSARTDANGEFTLVLRDPVANATLEVAPTADNPGYPTVRTEIDVGAEAEPIDLGDISLGAVLAPVRFQARVVDADGVPVPNASLSVRGSVGNGEVTALLTADADGNIDSSALPPATYEAFVYGPPESTTAGILVEDQLDVPSSNADLVFTLPRRVSFNGRVVDPDDANLAGASLTLLRIGDIDGVREPVLGDTLIQFSAVSDAAGQFDVALDPGRYRLTTRPPPGSTAPGNSEIVNVTEAGLRRNVNLPDRAFVVGAVLFDGQPVPSAYVRVFSTLEDERGAAIVLGEGIAGPDGAFEIVVSDRVNVAVPDPP